jgi:hypothetical protein
MVNRVPVTFEWLPATPRSFARDIGLEPRTTPNTICYFGLALFDRRASQRTADAAQRRAHPLIIGWEGCNGAELVNVLNGDKTTAGRRWTPASFRLMSLYRK